MTFFSFSTSPFTLLAMVIVIVTFHHVLCEKILLRYNLLSPQIVTFLATVGKTNNYFYSAASGLMFLAGTVFLLPDILLHSLYFSCGLISPRHEWLLELYFWSKLWEGLWDLSIVTLRGFPIHIHFRLHHYSTPIFAWLGLVTRSTHGAVFLLLNTFMHLMVYAFHGGFQPPWLKSAVRGFQWVQLGGGMLVSGVSYLQEDRCGVLPPYDVVHTVVPGGLYALYLVLFQFELRDERKMMTMKSKK